MENRVYAHEHAVSAAGHGAGVAAPERDQWQGSQVIDADRRGGRLRVAHREPEPDAAWPTPRPLEGSANNLLEVRDSDATESGGRDLIAGSAGAV